MSKSHLRVDHRDGGIVVVTLDRQKALNALSSAVLDELDDAITRIENAKARVVIITGAGEKAFVAGADIAEMLDMDPEQATKFARRGGEVFARLETLPQVVIAAVNGFALGGGCELALACDLIYASDRARFGQPEVNLAVIPGFGGTQRLLRLVGPMLARELVLTGRMVKADEALRIGLVAAVYSADELMDEVLEVAATIAKKGPLAVAAAKRLIRGGQDLSLEDAIAREAEAFGRCFATSDQSEGMKAFLDRREANFTGS